MEQYDVFPSEGGYRVCLGIHNNNPVIDKCPWFKTKSGAKAVARETKFKNETRDYGVFKVGQQWIASLPGETKSNFCDYETRNEAVESVISAIEKLGYSREYILHRRKDLL